MSHSHRLWPFDLLLPKESDINTMNTRSDALTSRVPCGSGFVNIKGGAGPARVLGREGARYSFHTSVDNVLFIVVKGDESLCFRINVGVRDYRHVLSLLLRE